MDGAPAGRPLAIRLCISARKRACQRPPSRLPALLRWCAGLSTGHASPSALCRLFSRYPAHPRQVGVDPGRGRRVGPVPLPQWVYLRTVVYLQGRHRFSTGTDVLLIYSAPTHHTTPHTTLYHAPQLSTGPSPQGTARSPILFFVISPTQQPTRHRPRSLLDIVFGCNSPSSRGDLVYFWWAPSRRLRTRNPALGCAFSRLPCAGVNFATNEPRISPPAPDSPHALSQSSTLHEHDGSF